MGQMYKVIKQFIKCLFGYHRWVILSDMNGEMSRTCISCDKKEIMRCGDWYPDFPNYTNEI